MSQAYIAIPSNAPGGVEASPSAHFGHCDAYTLARVKDGEVTDVSVHYNGGHEHGNCLAPVRELADLGVNVLIAGGMGMRPLMAMQEAGMQVYFSTGKGRVGDVIHAFAAGELQPFVNDHLCKGGCGGHAGH